MWWDRSEAVLFVFAHPDDSEISCAGTIARLCEQGNKVYVLELTGGEKSSSDGREQRVVESQAAAHLLGYTLLQENLSDGSLRYDIDLISLIEQYMNNTSPHVVITHYPQIFGEGHQDHLTISSAVVNVALRCSFVSWILYSEPTIQSRGFIPNLFIDVTKFMDIKRKAVNMHRTETHKPYMKESTIDIKAKWWALQASLSLSEDNRYFEAFEIVKGILKS